MSGSALPSMHEALGSLPEPSEFHTLPKGTRTTQGMLAHAYSPRTEAGGLLQVHHQPGLLSETLSQETKQKQKQGNQPNKAKLR